MPNKFILVLVGLFLFSAYTGVVYTFGYSKAELDYAEQDKKDLVAALEDRDRLQAQINFMSDQAAELVHRLRNAKLEGQKYATAALRSNTCNPLRGYISVLNVQKGYPLGTPDNPALAAGEDEKPSTVTGERINRELEQCEIDYQLAITRLNGLIDSVLVLQ